MWSTAAAEDDVERLDARTLSRLMAGYSIADDGDGAICDPLPDGAQSYWTLSSSSMPLDACCKGSYRATAVRCLPLDGS